MGQQLRNNGTSASFAIYFSNTIKKFTGSKGTEAEDDLKPPASRRRKELRLKMGFLRDGKVETYVIFWNLNLVEKTLKVRVSIDRVEQILKAQRRVLWKGVEAIDQNTNVVKTRSNRRESIIPRADLELSGFFNLGRPNLDVVVLENWSILNIHFLGSRSAGGKLFLQRNNLKEMLDH